MRHVCFRIKDLGVRVSLNWNKKIVKLFLERSRLAFSVCIFVSKKEKQSTAKTLMSVWIWEFKHWELCIPNWTSQRKYKSAMCLFESNVVSWILATWKSFPRFSQTFKIICLDWIILAPSRIALIELTFGKIPLTYIEGHCKKCGRKQVAIFNLRSFKD